MLSPTITLPDGTSLGLEEMSHEVASTLSQPSLTRALIAQASLPRSQGVFLAIDEAQKLNKTDAVIDPLGKGTKAYLQALMATMDSQGFMASDSHTARSLGKPSSHAVATYRQRLISQLILKSSGRGKVQFCLPYITRYFKELHAAEAKAAEADDGWTILQ